MGRAKWWIAGLLITLAISQLAPGGKAVAAVADFYNVISQDGADPWVYKHTDGYYYSTRTTGGDVTIWRSKTISGIDAGEKKTVWKGCCNIWAPEIHYISGKWYIYYAKDDGNNLNHRMYVLENGNADPFSGTFADKGKISDATDKWAIDGTVLQTGGHMYFIWSGWENAAPYDQYLYIAHMSNPWTIDSARTEIARPLYAWESNINEGPQVIVKGTKINLIYSANQSWTNNYNLGQITASTGSNLLLASSWTKKNSSIFASANGLYGPGHHSFTKSPDGTEDWMVYHVAKFNNAGWNREIRAQKFTWNADNTPNLGAPISPLTKISIPSGEPQRDRYEGESGAFTNSYASTGTGASGGSKAGHIDYANSYVDYNVTVGTSGFYMLSARTGNGTGAAASLKLSVNGGLASPLSVTSKAWDNWGVSTAVVWLNSGSNNVRFAKGTGYVELDCFDIVTMNNAAFLAGKEYKLINPNSGKALDVAGTGTANGTDVIIWADSGGGVAQRWMVIAGGNGIYKLINPHSGKALDVAGSGTTNGTDVIIWADSGGGVAQQWQIVSIGGGQYKLINPNSAKALDVAGSGTVNGTDVIIWQDTGSAAQKWVLVPLE